MLSSMPTQWSFPAELQPDPQSWRFDLDAALDAVVALRAEIPEDAFTAPILGTERAGHGVAIGNESLLLTIGYLIAEASSIWLTTNRGAVVAGHSLAYDQNSGLGLVQALGPLGVRGLERSSAASCAVGDEVIVAGHGGRHHALKATVFARREFAGYWEYVLDEAIFTAPAHPHWGGTALIGADGRLLGIGSLLVEEKHDGETLQGNMVVPIDVLEPIFDDLRQFVNQFQIHPLMVVAAICVIYVLLGCVLESISMILLTVPVFYPLVQHLGFDLVWFGVIVVVVTEISLITPPIGMNVFVLRTLLPEVPTTTIFRGVTPFIVSDVFRLALLVAVPGISLLLPGYMG